jgi:ferric-dicitrate binding protein FerR (iron transport regulator)
VTALTKVQSEALDWFFELTEHPDLVSVRAEFQAWMRASKAHRDEFAALEGMWRLAGPLFKLIEPDAGPAEDQALLEAVWEELARCPHIFADS